MAMRLLFLTGLALLHNVEAAGDGPITKVVNLLKEMQKELDAEAKKDSEMYEKLKCWCDTNGGDKKQAVSDQKDQIDQLNSQIEESSAKKAELTTEISGLQKDIADATQALAEATEIRKKEAAEFNTEETGLLKSVTLLKGAIVALSKQHAGLLQAETSELATMRPALRKVVHQQLQRLDWLQASPAKEALLDFIKANDDILEPDTPIRQGGSLDGLAMLQKKRQSMPVFKSYAPQSGQVMGILKQMKEAFEIDLPEIQETEAKKVQGYNLMKGEKEAELKEYQDSVKEKTTQLADAKETLANAKSDLKDTKDSLDADQAFLLEMTERCTKGDYEWERRQKMRSDEIAAVSQAISILDTDEARDGQAAAFAPAPAPAPAFLQRSSVTLRTQRDAQRRARAVALLKKVVAEAPSLSFLLVSAKADPFVKVIKAIDDLSAKLKTEMADEVKHKDFCDHELQENKVSTEKKEAKQANLETKLADLASQKKTLEDAITNLKNEISETQVQMQRATEDRKAENLEFQTLVADQIRAIGALKAAHEKLAAFYFKDSSLVQRGALTTATGATTVAPSPEFEDYENNGNSNKIMTLITKLTGEAEVAKDNAVSDEQNAADAYVKLVGESNAAIKAKSKAVVNKKGELASTEEEISQATLDKDATLEDLETLAATKAELHGQCDFIINNFTTRQQARGAEMDALAEVKAILSGMKA
jgi:peptidoglycan hydrolase CwlO-like protein